MVTGIPPSSRRGGTLQRRGGSEWMPSLRSGEGTSSCSKVCPVCFQDTLGLTNSNRTDVSFVWDPSASAPPNFTGSPYTNPTAEICYRTMPQAPRDGRLRPGLRLGESDASIRRVAALITWFERPARLWCVGISPFCPLCAPIHTHPPHSSFRYQPWKTKTFVSEPFAPF